MTELTDLSETDADNTSITSASIAEGSASSGINNAIRNLAGLIRRAFKTSIFRLRDSTDQTKLLALNLSAITTGTTRTLSVADANGTILTSTDVASAATVAAANNVAQIVTPGRVVYSPGVAKCWVHCGSSGNVFSSYGVSSITDNGVGDVTVNHSVTFPSNNGPIFVTPFSGAARIGVIYDYTSTTFSARCYTVDTNLADGEWFLSRYGTIS